MIDGRCQDIEYEGLPTICFKCGRYGHAKESCGVEAPTKHGEGVEAEQRDPEELYGPWMQVVNRRRRNGIHQISTGIKGGSGKAKEVMGSRFTALAEETDMGTLQVELGLVMESHEPPMQYREMTSNSPIGVPKVAKTAGTNGMVESHVIDARGSKGECFDC
ncbi:hypothetical protein V6N13_082487 [Hibiscus sabdariffa]